MHLSTKQVAIGHQADVFTFTSSSGNTTTTTTDCTCSFWNAMRLPFVELLHQGATSPSSLEQGQHPAQENPELPTSLSDEDDEQYEVFQRAPEKPQSDGRNEILQLASDPAEPLETMPANREAHRAHDAGACGTLDKTAGEVQLLQNTLPSTSSAEPSDNVFERLGKLKVPTKVKPRGRPKGAEKTVNWASTTTAGTPSGWQGTCNETTAIP
ncbi:hypothetical protein HPB48_026548 [Haemaphysalis longicornis]|uniref:Uncharacterized protein n=1 Tax=Haemaphysalis longicornis TaxID=44386 RepID=A0A9J6HB10_HAELO|nr:hypothetical protein HPB48_026548 [Haemaphysalis longicornis]